MAKYLVLIYGDEQTWGAWSEEQDRANSAAHEAFHAEYGAAVLGAAELHPSAKAKSIRPDSGGRPTVSDGPFLETKEALGGYYLLEAVDLDEAVAMASRLPEAGGLGSGVEVRPLRQH